MQATKIVPLELKIKALNNIYNQKSFQPVYCKWLKK